MKRYAFWKQEIKNRTIMCQQCGDLRAQIVYHHDGNKENDEERNLILLCRPCHNYLTRVKKKTGETNRKEYEREKQRIHLLATWISKKRYYHKHLTLKRRIDEILRITT